MIRYRPVSVDHENTLRVRGVSETDRSPGGRGFWGGGFLG